MKNLKSISDAEILQQTRELVSKERQITLEILHLLKETDRRKLHCGMGYSSLFTYCVQELKYTESQAYRRVQALRALAENPELESKIESGQLSIATVSQVQAFCQERAKRKELVSKDEKRELFQTIEGKSKREVEKILVQLSPGPARPERVRPLDESHSEVRFVADEKLLAKLKRIQDLMSHQCESSSYSELLDRMAEIVLERIDPERKEARSQARAEKAGSKVAAKSVTSPEGVLEVFGYGRLAVVEEASGQSQGLRFK